MIDRALEDAMGTMGDRGDARTTTRIPFEALVEVAEGSDKEGFDAQSVDVSGEGMRLQTAYLPDVGQPLVCRFDAGKDTVTASGEVVWREAAARGGEFGVRFTGLDEAAGRAIEKIAGVQTEPPGAQPPLPQGRVRLHIEGLASPMRARVKDSGKHELTVGSELGFLQVGKQLELEDTETGDKRPAFIDRVEVEIDPDSHIPRLVVALRYEGDEPEAEAATDEPEEAPVVSEPPAPALARDEAPPAAETHEEDASSMKSAFARNAAKVTPAVMALIQKMKERAVQLAKRNKSEDSAVKRTTAPPPGGALHASGRKVVRGGEAEVPVLKRFKLDKRKVALGGAAGLALVLVALAVHKSPASAPSLAPVASAEPAPVAPAPNPVVVVPDPMLTQVTPTVTPAMPDPAPHSSKPVHVAPFANGTVTHGTVLRLKMDGEIEKINGAAEPTGFAVTVPGHKSLEPAGPLAARDSRIASIRVTNDATGAQLDLAFKDGVPNYLVRAKGDTLEIVLAPIASHESPTTAKKPPSAPPKKPAHGKH